MRNLIHPPELDKLLMLTNTKTFQDNLNYNIKINKIKNYKPV